MVNKLVLVFLGGGVGTVLRYIVNYSFSLMQIPQISTFLVNILGSFIFGIIYVYIAQNTILTLLYFFGTIFLSIFAGLLGIYIGTKMGT